MNEEKITLVFPDSSRTGAQLHLSQDDLILVTEESTISIPLTNLTACRRDRKKDNACRVSTKDRMAYTLVFSTEKKLLRFMAALDAQCEDLTINLSKPNAPKRGLKRLPLRSIAILTAVCVLIAALGVGGYFLLDYLIPHYGSNDVLAREIYAVTSARPGGLTMKHSVAVNADGDTILTNGELQVLFWMDVYQFMNTYKNYLSSFGLSTSKSLHLQNAMSDRTWEQYFLEMCTSNFKNYYALYCAAKDAGYVLPADLQATIDDAMKEDGTLASDAKKDGFADVDAYLKEQFGDGVDLETYKAYLELYYTAMSYYDDVVYAGAEKSITDEDVEKEYTSKADSSYKNYPQVYNVTIRHILIEPEGSKDTDDGSGTNTWSTTAWSLAEEKINEIYDKWKEDPTEDNFAALAKEYTDDDASKEDGGIYEDVEPNSMTTEFNDWIFDDARIDGETGIVKTAYGYHLIYFVEHTETRAWYDVAKTTLVSDLSNTTLTELSEKYPVSFDFSRMRIFDIIARNSARPVETVDR